MSKIGHIKIGGFKFTFVFRHKFEKNLKTFDRLILWRDFKLGLWYKRSRLVGEKNSNKPCEWKNNLVNEHMVGINLIICKAWFTVSKGGLSLKTK